MIIVRMFVALVLIASTTFGAWLVIRPFIPLTADELDACETVFRYQIDRGGEGIELPIYVTVRHMDAPVEIRRRLKSDKISAQPGSSFEGRGNHFVIRNLKRVDATTFLIDGGYENGPLNAAEEEFTVVRRNRKWSVDKVALEWVS